MLRSSCDRCYIEMLMVKNVKGILAFNFEIFLMQDGGNVMAESNEREGAKELKENLKLQYFH